MGTRPSSAADGGDDDDLRVIADGRIETSVTGVHAIDEDIHVRAYLVLLGQDTIPKGRTLTPQQRERRVDARSAPLDVDFGPASGVRLQRARDDEHERHQVSATALTAITGGRPSTTDAHDSPSSPDANTLPLRVPK